MFRNGILMSSKADLICRDACRYARIGAVVWDNEGLLFRKLGNRSNIDASKSDIERPNRRNGVLKSRNGLPIQRNGGVKSRNERRKSINEALNRANEPLTRRNGLGSRFHLRKP
jgi:hypothetical protein